MTSFCTTLHGHVTQNDKARSDYAYVPFDLPSAASRLQIRYNYSASMSSDQVEGGNVIDIGLFDPHGSGFPGGAGFRGWSGSARGGFFIAEDVATPGYLPGPLPAGRYEVILGLYRIWPQGADYDIHIEADLTDEGRLSASPFPDDFHVQTVGGSDGPVWLRGDLQSHTYHSDAKGSPERLVNKARDLVLDFLAITDHNTVSHHALLPELAGGDLLLIPGQEATTYYGHMNVWGTSRWSDFRCRTADDLSAVIELAHRYGGVCSINHPKTGGPAWEYGFDLDVQAMEVWQGPWPYRNDESLALWDRLLRQGRRIPAVGGSDYHCPADAETNLLRLGQPTTWVHARDRSIEAILEAICAGRTCISASPQGPRLDLTAESDVESAKMGAILAASPGTQVDLTVTVWDGAGYQLQVIVDGTTAEVHEIGADSFKLHTSADIFRYVRCEIVGDVSSDQLPQGVPDDLDTHDWRWALSNPIYVERAESNEHMPPK